MDDLRAFTVAEMKRRDAKLDSMGPDGRAWFYMKESEIRAKGPAAWDEYLKREFGPRRP